MIPIIFPHPNGSGTALRGTPLIGFACLATLLNAWEQLYFFISKRTRTQHKQKEYKVSAKYIILTKKKNKKKKKKKKKDNKEKKKTKGNTKKQEGGTITVSGKASPCGG